jgi:hypothetical protein
MAEPLDKKEIVSMEELVMSQMWELQALYNLMEKKGLITKDELLNELKRIKTVNRKTD